MLNTSKDVQNTVKKAILVDSVVGSFATPKECKKYDNNRSLKNAEECFSPFRTLHRELFPDLVSPTTMIVLLFFASEIMNQFTH